MEEAKKTYLVGFKISRWLETNAFRRFIAWYQVDGFCYALSALMMLMTRDINAKEIRIARGKIDRKENNEDDDECRHSWLEIKIPYTGWYVLDLSWMLPRLIRRRTYMKETHLKTYWICNYDEFWALPYSRMMRDAIEKQETSYIFTSLLAYSPYENKDFTFGYFGGKEWPDSLPWNGHAMPPFVCYGTKNWVSSQILRDFVKKSRRLQPKSHSCRTVKIKESKTPKETSG